VLSAISRLKFHFFFTVFSLPLLSGIAKEGKIWIRDLERVPSGQHTFTHLWSYLGFGETSKKGIVSVSGLGKRTAICGCMEFI
jgi:hypothetical protein